MSSYFNMSFIGQVGINPEVVSLATSDSLATMTAAGWVDKKPTVQKLSESNLVLALYDFNPPASQGTYQYFTVSITSGVTTLVPYVSAGAVTLPVVSGDFAIFDGTTGKIKDIGLSPTDATSTKVVTTKNGPFVVNNLLVANDVSGTARPGLGVQVQQVNTPNGGAAVSAIAFTAGVEFGGPAITSGTGFGSKSLISASAMGDAVLGAMNALGSFGGVSTGGNELSGIKSELSIDTLAIQADDIVACYVADCGEPADAPSGSLENLSMFFGSNRTTAVIGSYFNILGAADNMIIIDQDGTPGCVTTPAGATPGGNLRAIQVRLDGADYLILASATLS